jgi:hypothetical protein
VVVLLSHFAVAAPVFVSTDPADIEVATAAWAAGVECAGWEAPAHDVVEVGRGFILGGYLGRAMWDEQGLYRIDLDRELLGADEVIVHEVAHAWVTKGPPALTEGRAELLADCIAGESGIAPLQWDDGRELVALPDLTEWSHEGHSTAALGAVRTDAYLGAARLLRATTALVPPRQLWPESGELDWQAYRQLLGNVGADGELFLERLDGGTDSQRQALSDPDLDGVPTLAEHFAGTDPERWDSNGDGWWDGAPAAPLDGIALPMDGTPVCTGWATPSDGSIVRLEWGGNLRGIDLPDVRIWAGSQGASQGSVAVLGARSMLVSIDPGDDDALGGAWARVEGDLIQDTGCTSNGQYTVFADDPALKAVVPRLAPALHRAMVLADDRLSPIPGRIALALGGHVTEVSNGVVHLDDAVVWWAMEQEAWDELAALAVALHRVYSLHGHVQWNVVTAIARSLAAADQPE